MTLRGLALANTQEKAKTSEKVNFGAKNKIDIFEF
jgi:hypothetical protein